MTELVEYFQVIQPRTFCRKRKILGTVKLDVATVMNQKSTQKNSEKPRKCISVFQIANFTIDGQCWQVQKRMLRAAQPDT